MDFHTMQGLAMTVVNNDNTKVKCKDFSQSLFMIEHQKVHGIVAHSKQGGICRALATEYLVHNYKRRTPGAKENLAAARLLEDDDATFFEKFKRENYTGTKTDYAEIVSDAQKRSALGLGQVDEQAKTAAIEGTVSFLSNNLMKYKGKTDLLPDTLLQADVHAPRYIYVSSGAHAMAVVAVQSKDKVKYKFFDPNHGQAVFVAHVDLLQFMSIFFKALNQPHVEFYEFS